MRKLGYRGIYRERTNRPKYVWAIVRTNDNLSRNSFIAYEKDIRLYDRSWQRDCGITFSLFRSRNWIFNWCERERRNCCTTNWR